jgi:hypothetical protein
MVKKQLMENKKINIIIDSQKEESTLGVDWFEYKYVLPKELEINYCELDEITTEETYLLFIEQFDDALVFIKNLKNRLEYIKTKINILDYDLKIILVSPHESPDNTIEIIKILTNIIKNNNWNESQFYIINNNSALPDIKKLLNSNMNFVKMNYLLRIMSDNQIKPVPSETDIIFDKKFIFLCLNRKSHNFRIAILAHLKNLKLLENDITNWSSLNPFKFHSNEINSLLFLKKYISFKDKNLLKNCIELFGETKLSHYEQNDDSFYDGGEWYPVAKGNKIDTFNNSYINIVTETHFELQNYKIHITEKSFKPFYFFQMPIFLAPYNHIKTMREEYDFYFFDDLIDHSYDNEIDDTNRFNMVIDEIKKLSCMREEIQNYYKKNIDKIIHNHNFIKTYSEKKIEEKYYLELIDKKL